ncbi:hypothetical protein GOP47_0006026 [Adiantum capillus-veneris]|uniref:Myb-like domain-containing protein n=1 Tax=Adiantum capillus-veneris TaxID=13818 RepID=A0A9D4ZMN3_ADICA|nr:hypothetical protein GOP47_0006026 [Adiantum capillus-veneris]
METPLDLNFSQRGIHNTVRVQNELDSTLQPKSSEENAGMSQEDLVMGGDEVAVASSGGNIDAVETPVSKTRGGVTDTPLSKTRAGSAAATSLTPQKAVTQWTLNEMNVLFEAKKAQAEKAESGPRKLRSSTPGKWEEIAESCKALGVQKSASQCREKWERLWPAFRTILDWELRVSEKKTSYWTMTEEERMQGRFPSVFEREVYDAMLARFGFVTSLNPASPILISLNVDSGGTVVTSYNEPGQAGISTDIGKEVGQNGVVGGEDGQLIVEQKTSGRKRKATERGSATKQSASDNNKKVTILLDPKEEAIGNAAPSPSREPRSSKSKVPLSPLDITERRLLLEERKMKLAEQRFSLEEKKLEATIEIGKGLIASMERMTGTISGLGPTPQHR